MLDKEQDVNAESSTAVLEETELDEDGTPVPEGEKDTESVPDKIEDRGAKEIFAENKRKQTEIVELKKQNERLLDSLIDKAPVHQAVPQKKFGELSNDTYSDFETEGMSKSVADKINRVVLQAITDYDERIVRPNEQKLAERANKSEVKAIVAENEVLKPYETEIMDELNKLNPEERLNQDAAFKAAELVKARHFNDIIKEIKSNVRAEAKKDRKILPDGPITDTTVTYAGVKVPISAEQKKLCEEAGVKLENYAKRYVERMKGNKKGD